MSILTSVERVYYTLAVAQLYSVRERISNVTRNYL